MEHLVDVFLLVFRLQLDQVRRLVELVHLAWSNVSNMFQSSNAPWICWKKMFWYVLIYPMTDPAGAGIYAIP